MADYTIVRVADVPDQAAEVGMDPDHFEIRFLREALGLRNFAVTFERFGGGWQPPPGTPAQTWAPAYGSGRGLLPRVGPRAGQLRRRGDRSSSPGRPCASRLRR